MPFVQSYDRSDTLSTNNGTLTGVAAGSLIALFIVWSDTGVTLNSLTIGGVAATILDNPTIGGGAAALAYRENVSAGSNAINATFSGVVSSIVVGHEISSVLASGSNDGHKINTQTNPGTVADAVTSTAIVTTVNGDYIFGATADTSDSAAINAGSSPFVQRVQHSAAGAMRETTEDQIQGVAGSIAATFTDTFGSANNLTGIMAFKAVAAGDLLQGAMLIG